MNLENRKQLSPQFFEDRGIDVARKLIGKLLINEETGCGGIIVETEAYLGENDPSCHFAKSQNGSRAEVFRNGAGTIYVYNIHTHNCMNFISKYRGNPEGILIRAVEPVKGVEEMKARRGWEKETKLASGPGKLTEALGITKEKYNGQNILDSPISIYSTDREPEIEVSARIGISKAVDWPARFLAKGNQHVSRPKIDPDTSFDFNAYYQNL